MTTAQSPASHKSPLPNHHDLTCSLLTRRQELLPNTERHHRGNRGINLPVRVLSNFPNTDRLPRSRMPIRVSDVTLQHRVPVMEQLPLQHRSQEPLAIQRELLTNTRRHTAHIERDRMLSRHLVLQLAAVLSGPSINIRFPHPNVSPEPDHSVLREHPVDRGVHVLPRDLTTVVLRVPRLNQEDRTVLDPASHKSRPVARLRTVERQPDAVARLKLHIRLARIPLVRGDPRILGRIDLVQVLAPGLRDRVLPVQNRSNIVIDRQPVSITRSDLQPLAELLDTSLKTLRINRLRRNLRDRRIRRSLNR